MTIGAGSAIAQTAPSIGVPLSPSGKWNVEYSDNMCVLSHDYGPSDGRVTVGFRPFPLTNHIQIILVTNQKAASSQKGTASVILGAIDKRAEGDYFSWSPPNSAKRITTFYVREKDVSGLADASTITLDAKDGPSVSVAPIALKAALAALKTCEDDLVKGWDVDPAEQDRVTIPASDDNPAWINNNDYPVAALSGQVEGDVMILWKIDTDGSAKDCALIIKTGNQDLDAAPCRLITQRAHYRPATDVEGHPIPSHRARLIRWRLPE